MDKKQYMAKLSREVRWRLPKQEAAEVLADYEELLPRAGEAGGGDLIRDFGAPAQAARLLTERRSYRRWLTVFVLLAACIVAPEIALLRASFYRNWELLMVLILLAGTAVSLVWFRPRRGEVRPPLPRGLLPALAVLALGLLAAGGVLWGLAAGAWLKAPPGWYGPIARVALSLAGTAAALAGLWGLAAARMTNRRWRALYVFALMVLAECVLVMALLSGMTLDHALSNWWVEYVLRSVLVAAIGLTGTGASLC